MAPCVKLMITYLPGPGGSKTWGRQKTTTAANWFPSEYRRGSKHIWATNEWMHIELGTNRPWENVKSVKHFNFDSTVSTSTFRVSLDFFHDFFFQFLMNWCISEYVPLSTHCADETCWTGEKKEKREIMCRWSQWFFLYTIGRANNRRKNTISRISPTCLRIWYKAPNHSEIMLKGLTTLTYSTGHNGLY